MKQNVYNKLRWYLLFTFALCYMPLAFAGSGKQTPDKIISVDFKNETLVNVIKDLKSKTGYEFLYNLELVNKAPRITVKADNKPFKQVLELCLEKTDFTYQFVDSTVVIKVKEKNKTLIERKITGIVMDEAGIPLPGTTIVIKGTRVGIAADTEGKFELKLPDVKELVLVVSFLGYETREVKITDQKEIKVTLNEKKENLQDVVVTGYSNVKKSSFTGASTRVEKEDILKVSPTNVIDVLQVYDPSLRIVRNNEMGSDPNTLPEFYVRGRSGIGVKELDKGDVSRTSLENNPNNPVFILDGYEVKIEKIYDLDPNRIQSINILKDAAATAIYGSRAANGVIVIESVAPKPGELQVSYTFTGAITTPDLSDYNLMNAREKLETEVLAGLFEGKDDKEQAEKNAEYHAKLNNIIKGVDTYWLSLPLTTQFNHKHSLYVEGGTNEIRYGISLRYNGQNGVMKKSYRNTYGGDFYLDYRFKKIQIRNMVTYDKMSSRESPYGSFSDYTKKNPYDYYKNEDGSYMQTTQSWNSSIGTFQRLNPMYEAHLHNYDKSNYNELTDNLNINWYVMDQLLVKGQLSLSQYYGEHEKFTDPLSSTYMSYSSSDYGKRGDLYIDDTKTTKMDGNVLISYNNVIGKHNMNFSAGVNFIETKTKSGSEHYRGFPSGQLHSVNYAAEEANKKMISESHTRLFGAFISLNYTYDDIYLFDLSGRLDGSSEFGNDNRTAPFWSGGFGINFHNYDFLKGNSIFSQLKLRATYGQTGKVNFAPYAAKHTYKTINDKWYSTGFGVYMKYMGNEKLGWETTNTLNIGADIGLLNDRIKLVGSWYNKKTVDMVNSITIPASSGFTTYTDNMGEVQNRGIELDLKGDIINERDIYLSAFVNLAHNKNKILKISNSLKEYNDRVDEYFDEYNKNANTAKDTKYAKPFMKYTEGGSLTSIWGMKSLGINPADGNEILVNRDGSVTYDWNSSEQVIIGDSEPDVQGAFGINARYKGFTLSATFMYELGGQAYNQTLVDNVENVDFRNNADKRVLTDRWKQPGDIAKFKTIKDADKKVTRPTSRFCQDNNTLDFNSLTIGYDFNPELLKKIGFSMLRLQFNMKDIAHFSSIKRERGLSYPFARTFNFTLNASF
ncbi:SusC/RagA family TonB-linked outer membrane protein [Gabonibacter chumensis]|uniref:SusC/RagA family TonB-linked outer membrane protein n=1 Tax=Gabonibacter chumensis TaxID=2972474 RepID=UPI0025725233|nr:SusC/RagA family TonB-linked outer membrane protein [Gabonibacter chumensis]MCR9013368.1 SusC/RagA family TonB-linked outer membrane protein [Gabonibacter chumensis]